MDAIKEIKNQLRGLFRKGRNRVLGKDDNSKALMPAIDVVDCVPAILTGSAPRRCIQVARIKHVQTSIIQHAHTTHHLRAEFNGVQCVGLSLANLQNKDDSFLFSHRVISARHNCGHGQPVILFDFNPKGHTHQYVVADRTLSDVDLKCLSPLQPDAETLDGSDPRFFIHHWVSHAYSQLESLKHRGYFLAVDSSRKRVVLRRKTNNEDKDFHFHIKPLKH